MERTVNPFGFLNFRHPFRVYRLLNSRDVTAFSLLKIWHPNFNPLTKVYKLTYATFPDEHQIRSRRDLGLGSWSFDADHF